MRLKKATNGHRFLKAHPYTLKHDTRYSDVNDGRETLSIQPTWVTNAFSTRFGIANRAHERPGAIAGAR
jgi:hypothetical protein